MKKTPKLTGVNPQTRDPNHECETNPIEEKP